MQIGLRKKDILIKQLQFELAKQKSFSEVYKEHLRKEKEFRDIEDEDLIPIITISNFSKDSIANAHKEFGIRNRIIWFRETRISKPATRFLLSIKPKIVIADFDKETKKMLKSSNIIVVDGIEPEMKKYYAAISADELKDTIKKTEKKSFLNWLEEYRKR
jgi:predicted RNase H-like nuclease (RuvC/YqgF family)